MFLHYFLNKKGKITLKNGKSYEVYFENDKFINANVHEEKLKDQTSKKDHIY